jgi:hypothetical protein
VTLRDLAAMLSRSRPDLPVVPVLAYLTAEYGGPCTPYFPREVARGVGSGDPSTVREVLGLLAAGPYRVLDERQAFVDESGRIELSREDLAEAAESGSFRHPHTGDIVHHWWERIECWYESGEKLDEVFPVQPGWIFG